ncbi:hypothetical protein BDN72DRAFT_864715 [Pluteus cervinus]|uniref:Uncharacterized protein n=1 Tax=Pluteus cervinus TaxID=181527 RepID=A0ACD3A2Q3_9AGAR|nr:hypothetical protein BDN72DRAFT_864715 [Pluteus cervinus]
MCLVPHYYTASTRDLVHGDAQSPQPVLVQTSAGGFMSPESSPFEPALESPPEEVPVANTAESASPGLQPSFGFPLEFPLADVHVVDTLPATRFTPPGFPLPATADTAQPAPASFISADGLTGPGVHAPVPVYAFQGFNGCINAPAPPPSRISSPNIILRALGPHGPPDQPPPPYAPRAIPGVDRPLSNPARTSLPFPGFVTTRDDVDKSRWQGTNGLLLLSEHKIGEPRDGKPKFLRARARVAVDQLRTVTTPDGPALCGSIHLVPSQHPGRAFYFQESMEAVRAMEVLTRTNHPRWFSFVRPYRGQQLQMMLLVLEEYPIRPITLDNLGQSGVPSEVGALLGREVDVVTYLEEQVSSIYVEAAKGVGSMTQEIGEMPARQVWSTLIRHMFGTPPINNKIIGPGVVIPHPREKERVAAVPKTVERGVHHPGSTSPAPTPTGLGIILPLISHRHPSMTVEKIYAAKLDICAQNAILLRKFNTLIAQNLAAIACIRGPTTSLEIIPEIQEAIHSAFEDDDIIERIEGELRVMTEYFSVHPHNLLRSNVTRGQEKTATIHSVPREMRLEVFRHVRDLSQRSIDALITLCQVCRQWRADVLGAPTLWSSIHNHSFISYNLNLVSDEALQHGPDTYSLVLATELPKASLTLQELQLCDVEVPASTFDRDFRNFRTLNLSYLYYPRMRVDWQIIALVLVQLTQLEELELSQALSLGKDVNVAVPVSLTNVAIPFSPPSLSILRVSEDTIHSMLHLFRQLRFSPNQLKELDVSVDYHRRNSDYEIEDVLSMEQQFRTLFNTWFGPEPFPNNFRFADGCCLTFAYGKTNVRFLWTYKNHKMNDKKYSGLSFRRIKNSQPTRESASSHSHPENRPPVSSSQNVERQSLSTTRTPTLAAGVSYEPIERQSSATWAQTSVASTSRAAYTPQPRTTSQFVSPSSNFRRPPAHRTHNYGYDNHSSNSFSLGSGSNNGTDGVNEWPHHNEASTSSSSRHMTPSCPPFPASPAHTAPFHPLPCVPYRPTNNPQHVQFTQSANGSFQANSTRPPSNHSGLQTAQSSSSSVPVIDDFWKSWSPDSPNNPTARPSSHSLNNEPCAWGMSEESQGWASTGRSSTRSSNSTNNPTSWTAQPSSQSSKNDWGSTSSNFFPASSKKHGRRQRRREQQWERAREVYTSTQPEAKIVTLADDRVPWIKPPVVADSRQGRWTRYQFEGTCFEEMRKGEEAEGDDYGLSRTYYDRHFMISIDTDADFTPPDGLTTDIRIFGLPCPDYPFMSRGSNGNLTRREKAPKWLYITRDPPAGSLGREPPTPRIDTLPLIGTPDPVTAAAEKQFMRQMDGSPPGSPCVNTQPSDDEYVGMLVSPQLSLPHQSSADNLHGYPLGSPRANTQPSDNHDKHVGTPVTPEFLSPDQPSVNSLPDAVAAASPDFAPQDKMVVDIPIAKGFCVSLPLSCDEVTPCGPPDDDDDDRISLGQDDSEWESTYLSRFGPSTIPPSDVEASNSFATSGSVVNRVDGGEVHKNLNAEIDQSRSLLPFKFILDATALQLGSIGALMVDKNSGPYTVDSPLDEEHRWLKRGRRGGERAKKNRERIQRKRAREASGDKQ